MCIARCGSAEGLDAGRHCLRKWGFRRCEDICWIKTNKDSSRKYMLHQDPHNCIVHTKVRTISCGGFLWASTRLRS
jgi:N6-adenosine-specific RNA methylase IME4